MCSSALYSFCVSGSMIYIIGGMRSPNPNCLQSVECFNIVTGTWVKGVEDFPHPVAGIACCAMSAPNQNYSVFWSLALTGPAGHHIHAEILETNNISQRGKPYSVCWDHLCNFQNLACKRLCLVQFAIAISFYISEILVNSFCKYNLTDHLRTLCKL